MRTFQLRLFLWCFEWRLQGECVFCEGVVAGLVHCQPHSLGPFYTGPDPSWIRTKAGCQLETHVGSGESLWLGHAFSRMEVAERVAGNKRMYQ